LYRQTKILFMKKLVVVSFIAFTCVFAFSCGGGNSNSGTPPADAGNKETAGSANPSYDPHRGEGKFTKVDVPAALEVVKAEAGSKVYNVKCQSCHKLTDEKLVGPGWKGVTSRHSPEWIMNFITNTDEMINKDPKAQAQLEICLVRMPNQNLTDEDARDLYEFQRQNDGVK
jgi:mono/diheme cytochrome c family protein